MIKKTRRSSLRARFLYWYAKNILRVPIIVEFTPEWMDHMWGVAFAWSEQAASRMRGDDRLIERVQNAEARAQSAEVRASVASSKPTRAMRRAQNRAAMKAAKKTIEGLRK